ncbi:MAG: class I SAM-dependent methyltransferase [Methanobacteriota archaeon]|nr:MAG: class I SAM-dependent methyltransferase [Euryarchaeota archaeon]
MDGYAVIEMTERKVTCPACGNAEVNDLGALPKVEGAIKINNPGHLMHCLNCNLFFRYPYPDSAALKKAYAEIDASGIWEYDDRQDYRLARQEIYQHCQSGKVLDVGCFRGDFLESLSDSYDCYGIEPSPDARRVAGRKDIQLIGKTIDDMDESESSFNAIVMLDVLEHLPRPMDALQKLKKMLAPNGILIVATGNTSALPWQLMRLDYWYYYPEHVCFVNRKWFDWAAKKLRMKVVKVKKFTHFPENFFVVARQFIQAMVYLMVYKCAPESLCSRLLLKIYPFSRAIGWTSPPKTSAWRDHILVVMKKVV